MVNPLPSKQAQSYALQLMESFDRSGFLDEEQTLELKHLFGHSGGQMFGVLVCHTRKGNEVVLKAFSGQFLGKWEVPGWVGPAFDTKAFEKINNEHLGQSALVNSEEEQRKLSTTTHAALTALYAFTTIDGQTLKVDQIPNSESWPSGTGDCCAPKLLHAAFKQDLIPVGLAEFYYGVSNSHTHKEFYPPCENRCSLILPHLLQLHILYVDDDIVVVNKPGGLLSVPGKGADKQDCIVNRVKLLYPNSIAQPAVHRLDMDSSGLWVLAFAKAAHRNLSIQFIKQQVKKRYEALVEGIIKEEQGRIELAFRYDPLTKPRQIYDPVNGSWGTTIWKRIRVESFGPEKRNVSRLALVPITGRTHQLRLHTSSTQGLAHPIVGDNLYGNGHTASRMMLHACELVFSHPKSKKKLIMRSEVPF